MKDLRLTTKKFFVVATESLLSSMDDVVFSPLTATVGSGQPGVQLNICIKSGKKIPIRHFDSRWNRVLLRFHLNIQSVWVHHIKTRDTHLHRCSHCTAFTKTPELWPPGPPAPLGAISHNYTWRRKLLLSHWTQLLSGSQRCSHLQAITHLPSPVAWNTHTRSTTSNLTPTEEPFYLQTPLCQAAAGQLFS